MHKVLKKYLHWTQNSLFEGDITKGKLQKCMSEVLTKIDPESDVIYTYCVSNPGNIKKEIHGKEKGFQSIFL